MLRIRPVHLLTAALSAGLALGALAAPASAGSDANTGVDGTALRAKAAKKSFKVTAAASTSELVLGKKVTIKGKVTPKKQAKGNKAILQKKIEGKAWKKEAVDKINKLGKFKFKDKPTSLDARSYRVVVKATKKVRKGKSAKLAVGVYRWSNLADLDARANNGLYGMHSSKKNPDGTVATINTKKFANSLVGNTWASTGYVDFNIERKCLKLTTTLGLDDTSDATASAKIDVSADTAVKYTHSFAFLQSAPVSIDLTDVFRLRFDYTVTDPTDLPGEQTGAVVAIATPQVLCAF